MPSKQLDQEYANIMKNHPYGIALYRPLPHSIFKPGACGYFDDFGTWNPIAHLESDETVLSKRGLKAIEDEVEKAPIEDGIRWGPMTSSNVRSRKIQLSGGVYVSLESVTRCFQLTRNIIFRDPMIGIPVGVSTVFSYSVDKDVGALLLTKAPIVHEHYYHMSPFKNWCRANSFAILSRWPEVKTHGLWIVTSVYTTKKCAINMWSAHGKTIEVGFSADATGIGSIGPSGEWSRSRTDEGWGEYMAKVCIMNAQSLSIFLLKVGSRTTTHSSFFSVVLNSNIHG